MTPDKHRWIAAQFAERRFHVDEVPEWEEYAQPAVRRHQERIMRYWYAAMLDIPTARLVHITDYGCGPQSLLLETPGEGKAIAVDPLRFTDEDEAAYQKAGIERVYDSAENYDGPLTQEGWMYNCLQHTQDWQRSLTNALSHTIQTFRLFEWINVPPDALHLHTLRLYALKETCSAMGFRETKGSIGVFGRPEWGMSEYYASVWERR
jgi:hypothetical protein